MSAFPTASVGSTPSAPAVSNPSATLGKDEFLELFVAQLRNQDPENPMDGQELAAQLAQFTTVEQLVGMNAKLDTLAASNVQVGQIMNTSIATNLIGKTVWSRGTEVDVADDGTMQRAAIDLGQPADQVTVRVVDETGTERQVLDLEGLEAGRHTLDLDALPAGHYTIEVTAAATDGTARDAQVMVEHTVAGVAFGPEGLLLTDPDGRQISLADVLEIAGA